MTTDQTRAAEPASDNAEQNPPRPSDQDKARLTVEIQAARAAEARQVAAAARLRARLFDVTERMLSVTGGQSAGTDRNAGSDHTATIAAAMADLRAELDDLTEQLDLQRSAAERARASLAERDAELQCVTAEAQEAGGQLSTMTPSADQTALAQMADDLQTAVQARDKTLTAADQNRAELKALTAGRDDLLARIAVLEQRLDARETALARMADNLQATGRARDEAKVLADQSRSEVQTLTALLERRLSELETARSNTAKARELADARQGEIDALLASTSWRITRPMRAFKSGLRSLRGR
ncbi:MAG: hypothetical protein ACK4GC_01035 [Paracoccaceae bacterium]